MSAIGKQNLFVWWLFTTLWSELRHYRGIDIFAPDAVEQQATEVSATDGYALHSPRDNFKIH